MEFWIKATLILCSYGFFKEMKPSEPFLTPYLKAQKNMTEEDLEKIYPVWTYSYLLTLLVVFLVTDLLRYKPVIIIEGLAYLATRILLIWAGGVLAMQFMQFVYGVATGAEVAYYSYIYAVVDRDHYKIVTSYTRAAVLLGRLISGVVGQLLITFKVTDYLVLNYISLGSVSISCILTLLLPKASGNVFITRTESDYLIEEQRNGCISSWKRTMITMFRDFKLCYSDKELLRWSLWWAFATGGEFQVENYVQNLWEIIYPSHNHKIYNGGVTAISHLTGSLVAIALAHVKINWSIFGELCLGVVSVADAFFLFQSAHTSNIWLAYLMYILFRTAYTFLITIASLQIAKHVEMSRFALVFGINMFAALLVSTILTAVVVDGPDLKLSVIEQFVIYGSYFVIIGAVFLARAVYHITRVGWRQSWQQRYVEMEAQPLEDVRNRDSQEDCTGELVAPNTGGLVIT